MTDFDEFQIARGEDEEERLESSMADLKKRELRAMVASLREQVYARRNDRQDLVDLRVKFRRVADELGKIKATWRPVPQVHEWQPRNPQCALCDEPRDSVRHQVAP